MSQSRQYESPPDAAYEPHTIFLLESRYPIKYGLGRTESVDHIVGLCRAADLEAVVKRYNSARAPSDAVWSMDNARWPWTNQKKVKSYSSWWSRTSEITDSLANQEDALMTEPIVTPNSKPVYQNDPERKQRQTEAVRDRVEEADLDGVHSGMRREVGKIPFEVDHRDGGTYHPSGFKVPTPAADFAKYPVPPPEAEDPRSPQQSNPDAAIEYDQWQSISKEEGGLMSDLSADIMSGDFNAGTTPRDGKIPTEVSGILVRGRTQPPQHASGFIPPTPAMARGANEAHTHTVEAELTKEDKASKAEYEKRLKEHRERYIEEMRTEPFWRPLLAITVSTRPIAATLTRLSRALSRGLPFYASVESDGRKSLSSFGNRMRCLRLDRMQELTVEMAQILAGARGGPIGIRFNMNQVGRGIGGENLDAPVPWEKRTIGIAVGEWYDRAQEVKDSYTSAQEEVQKYEALPEKGPFIVYGVNDWGKPLTDQALPWLKEASEWDAIPDSIRDVFNEINELQRMLNEEDDTLEEIYILVENIKRAGDEALEVRPVGEVRETTKGAEVPPGYFLAHGNQARFWVKKRIEFLSREHSEELSKAISQRLPQVTYP